MKHDFDIMSHYLRLAQFEHACRAAAAFAGVKKIQVLGANAMIQWLASKAELDLLINGAIGEMSLCGQTIFVTSRKWSTSVPNPRVKSTTSF